MLRTKNGMFFIVVFLLAFFLLILGVVIYRLLCTSFYLKRIRPYTIEPEKDNDLSLLDLLEKKEEKLKNKISKVLSKSLFFRKYSERYYPYLRGKEKKMAMDYVTTKLFASVISVFIYGVGCLSCLVPFSWIFVLASFLFGFLIPDFYWEYQKRSRLSQVKEDLWRAITVMENTFQAGMSISQVLRIAAREVEGPLGEEFDQIINDLEYGLDFTSILRRFYERCPIEEVHYMTTSLMIMNQTGGDISSIFQSMEENFLARKKLHQEMKSATSSSSAIFKILVAMPLVITIFLLFLNSSYFESFLTTPLGLILLGIIIALYIIYILIIRQVMKIED